MQSVNVKCGLPKDYRDKLDNSLVNSCPSCSGSSCKSENRDIAKQAIKAVKGPKKSGTKRTIDDIRQGNLAGLDGSIKSGPKSASTARELNKLLRNVGSGSKRSKQNLSQFDNESCDSIGKSNPSMSSIDTHSLAHAVNARMQADQWRQAAGGFGGFGGSMGGRGSSVDKAHAKASLEKTKAKALAKANSEKDKKKAKEEADKKIEEIQKDAERKLDNER